MMIPLIEQHFANKDFDIRKKYPGYSRFMDQKVTPDVLSFIADCILNLDDASSFTVRDIWESKYFIKNTEAVFGKPTPSKRTARSEYNKFIGQPLKTLAYSQVLKEDKIGNTSRFTVNNHALLDYIARNERGAFGFICAYLRKVLTDSGFYPRIKDYENKVKENPESRFFDELKERFHRFMLGHTNINNTNEIYRIFPKVINPLAVEKRIPGSKQGRITKNWFLFMDLMYNRTNFRDIDKPKHLSRQEAPQTSTGYLEYRITKAKSIIRSKYSSSELRDSRSPDSATHVNHIFPQASYPEYAAHTENLILLTVDQHLGQAHPRGNTSRVDFNYQIQCLLAKCDSIETSLHSGEFIYSKESFIHMINECLKLKIALGSSFDEVRDELTRMLKAA